MAPIEVFFGTIVFIFALIGLVRGFLKELGVTMVMMFLLFFLSTFEPYLSKSLVRMVAAGARYLPTQDQNFWQCVIFTVVIIATAFISYQGETLAFGGQPPKGGQGILLGSLTGLLNGYLIAGSLWFYMDKFSYPFKFLGFAPDKFSPLAREIIAYLPIRFLGQPIFLNQSLLLYLSVLLIIARVIR